MINHRFPTKLNCLNIESFSQCENLVCCLIYKDFSRQQGARRESNRQPFCKISARNQHCGLYKPWFHQEFQVPKTEGFLNLISFYVGGWVFPYISRIHTAYRGEYLQFRYLKCLVMVSSNMLANMLYTSYVGRKTGPMISFQPSGE